MLFVRVGSQVRLSHSVRTASTNPKRLIRQKEERLVDCSRLHFARMGQQEKRLD
jgi:hypothetical protein